MSNKRGVRERLVAAAESEQRSRARRIERLRTCAPEIAKRALDVFESFNGAAGWLIEPTNSFAGLKGKAPIDVINTPKGREAVLQLLGRIEHCIPP